MKTSNSEKKLFSISEPVTVKTYELPREIIHLSSSEQNLTVGWTSPSDGSAYYFKFQCQKVSIRKCECEYQWKCLKRNIKVIL